MSENEFIFSLKNVSYTHDGKDTPALKNITLNIRRGTLVMIVGPSGSGKSTLCDILAGVNPHINGGYLEGEVFIDGIETRQAKEGETCLKVGKIFQDAEVMFSAMEVEDEIAFGPENRAVPTAGIAETVDHCLEFADLTQLRHNLVWELSGGQAQRLGIAAILAMQTPVIIMDEPTANLDPKATRFVHDMALRLRDEGHTIILVTKESDEMLEQADEIIVLDDGRVLCVGRPQAVINEMGDFISEKLGIWLPEVTEIGLGLRQQKLWTVPDIPLNIDTALAGMLGRIEFRPGPAPAEAAAADRGGPDRSSIVTARDICYYYPGNRIAVKGISFDICRGDFLAIVGRNGAGKSTLSKMLVGLQKPQQGSLEMFGKNAKAWNVADLSRKIALVFQNPEHQFLTDSVFDEIAYTLKSKTNGAVAPAELQAAVDRVLKMLELEDVAQDHPFSLSAGKKRRLGVAAMLVGSPEVLVVDEPTYGQDKKMTNSLIHLMLQLRDMGITIIMITHNMRLVQEYAERVIVMSEGLITFDGYPGKLFGSRELLEQANLSVTSLQVLVEQLRERSVPVPGSVKSVNGFLNALKV
ncbi:MAG TPA: ABC transporter ATP-binding protein [Anaerolineaceae bacterium]|nr:ABC transporter ATP-binding protein [Anaerolineaceae bacterium]